MTGRIVFFDVETSGLDPNVHEVIQLAAIAVEADGLGEIERFEAKVQFDVSKASPEALEINSYNVEAWRSAKPRPMVVGQFSNFLRQHSTVQQISRRTGRPYNVAQLAGHNVASFDIAFLRAMFGSEFCPIRFIPLDTLQLASWAMHWHPNPPSDLKLGTLAQFFEIPFDGEAHDALADVAVTVEVAKRLRDWRTS